MSPAQHPQRSPRCADKGHTTERSRNPNGSLSGADRSTARDAAFWDEGDVYRRMDFSLQCAYAHGTSALRTHLINMTPKQTALTWPVFSKLRAKWAGKVRCWVGGWVDGGSGRAAAQHAPQSVLGFLPASASFCP